MGGLQLDLLRLARSFHFHFSEARGTGKETFIRGVWDFTDLSVPLERVLGSGIVIGLQFLEKFVEPGFTPIKTFFL